MTMKLTPPSGLSPGEESSQLLTDLLMNEKFFKAFNGKSLILQAEIKLDQLTDDSKKAMIVSGLVPVTLSKGIRNGKPTREIRIRGHLRRKRSTDLGSVNGSKKLGTVKASPLIVPMSFNRAQKTEHNVRKTKAEFQTSQTKHPCEEKNPFNPWSPQLDSKIVKHDATTQNFAAIPDDSTANWSPYLDVESPIGGPLVRENGARFSTNWDLKEGELKHITKAMGKDTVHPMKTRIAESAAIPPHYSPESTASEKEPNDGLNQPPMNPTYLGENGIQTYSSSIQLFGDGNQQLRPQTEIKKISSKVGEKLKHLKETKVLPTIRRGEAVYHKEIKKIPSQIREKWKPLKASKIVQKTQSGEMQQQKRTIPRLQLKVLPNKKEGIQGYSSGDGKHHEKLLHPGELLNKFPHVQNTSQVDEGGSDTQISHLFSKTLPKKKQDDDDNSKDEGNLREKWHLDGKVSDKYSHGKTPKKVEHKLLNPITTITICRSHTRFLRYNNGYEYCERSGRQMLTVEAPKGLYFFQSPSST